MNSLVEWKDKPVKYLRDKVIDQLKYNLSKDHLEIDEFDQLVRVALQTQSKSELFALVSDLPVKKTAEVKHSELEPTQARGSLISVLSDLKRKGHWILPKQLRVVSILGAAEIDFREVNFESDLTYIALDCWFGDVKIIIPPGVNVVSTIKNFASGIDHRSQRKIDPDSPTIVIEGNVMFGGFSIKEKAVQQPASPTG